MSKYQFRILCALAWLNLLIAADDTAQAVVALFFVIAYSGGAIWSQYKEQSK